MEVPNEIIYNTNDELCVSVGAFALLGHFCLLQLLKQIYQSLEATG